ncbi:MAG: RNA polymerase sigma factor SigJ [Actinomycetota bacterium]
MSEAAATFEANRSRLAQLAYRMLGSVVEAEDVVQEAWLRFASAEGEIRNPAAWLTTVTTRLAIDRLRSAQVVREEYVGPWLPEPIVTGDDPADQVVLAESLSLAFLTMLERLDPVERAAFVLREVFALPYADIAAVLERTEAGCRQLVHRAKQRTAPERPARYEPTPEEEQRLLDGFFAAVLTGDLDGLTTVLAADVVAWSDGGRDRRAARRPVVGRDRVVPYVLNLSSRYLEDPAATVDFHPVRLNGQPGVVVWLDGDVEMAMAFDVGADGIVGLRSVLNPRKLDHLRTPPPQATAAKDGSR